VRFVVCDLQGTTKTLRTLKVYLVIPRVPSCLGGQVIPGFTASSKFAIMECRFTSAIAQEAFRHPQQALNIDLTHML
jgi:hypothetical protein